ncbi:group 1 glycosyl transferase [Candidatus Magnetomorum sp. HK-1]|nr:group 1 glycosyl transferase [Candidatus Magnetomorum sp. HK-1]
MHAILINSMAMDGAERVVSNLIKHYHKTNRPVILICLEHNPDYNFLSDVPIYYLSENKGNETGLRKLISLFFWAKKLKELIISKKIEVIQSHLYRANYVNIIAKQMGAGHIAQIVNTGIISWYNQKGFLGRVNLMLIQLLYDKADLIILKTKGMQKDMQRLFEFRNPQCIISNPFDIDEIDELSKKAPDTMVFSTTESKLYITAVGRFLRLKNYDILIHAFANFCHSMPQAELLLIGGGPELKSLIKLSKRLNIYERVAFVQDVSNPYAYLKRSHIFVLPSSTEGFPNVLLEAMICSLPVVSTDCPSGPREILAPNTDHNQQLELGVEYARYGVLVPVRQIDPLTEAITRLSLDTHLRYRYAKNSRIRAMTFQKDHILEKYENIFFKNSKPNQKEVFHDT